jgi:putative colanic acid biosynthesis UDP-glucose lipid carrier transferase
VAGPRSVLKPHAGMFAAMFRVCDPVLTAIVGVLAHRWYLDSFTLPDHYLFFLAAGALALAAIFPAVGLYQPHRGASIAEELRGVTIAWLAIAALVGLGMFATKMGETYSRVWVGAWLLGGLVTTSLLRIAVRLGLRSLRVRGLNQRHVAIVGAGTLGRTVATRLRQSPWAGFSIYRFYDDDPGRIGTSVEDRPVLPTDESLLADVAAGHIDQVWLALPLRAEARIRQVLTMLRDHAVEVRFVPDIYGFHLLNHSVTEVAGLPVISLTETPMSGINRAVKAIEDYALAAILVALASPIMIAIAAGVKLSSRGPVLYRQKRVTWNGEVFEMLKFRTMPVTAEDDSGPVWAKRGESRATPFGAFLRRTSLDELPQLLNVLRGEMSLVGPRPERPQFVEQFRSQIPGYMQKHLVKAGITGWAQVNDLRGDTDLAQRIQYDLFYIDNWSLWFDLRILVRTLWHILTSRNAG